MWLGNHGQAAANLEQAISLNPSMSNAYGQLGSCHNLAGRPEIAVPLLEAALRLNPLDTENFHQHGELAFAHLAMGEPAEAAAAADRALALKPGYAYAHVLKVAACVQIGESSSIARAYSALTAAKPSVDSDFLQWIPYADRQWPVRLKAAVEEAANFI
jgi:adenylate cyclase